MAFMNSQGPVPGMNFSAPDVYLQATPVGPVPFPLFCMAMRITFLATCFRFLLSCMPGHTLFNMSPTSIAGPGPGALSGVPCGPSGNVLASPKFIVQCAPATCALTHMTANNGVGPKNSFGIGTPTQIRLVVL